MSQESTRRFCSCSDPDYCDRVSTFGMSALERAEWRRQRDESAARAALDAKEGTS